ncbi:MAG: hypothetical protein WB504_04545, partial [Pseudolabrys sp.]
FVPEADIREMNCSKQKEPPRGGLSEVLRCFDYAGAAASFRFLRHPSRPNAPRLTHLQCSPLSRKQIASGSSNQERTIPASQR